MAIILLKCSNSLNIIVDMYDLENDIDRKEANDSQNYHGNYIPVECKIGGQIEIKTFHFQIQNVKIN